MRTLFLVLAFGLIGASASAAQIETFDQKLDHASKTDATTFKQRFFIDSSLAENASSPVLYYICGEANCFDSSELTHSEPRLVRYEAQQLHAHIVILEHRYFGLSEPFDQLTHQNLRFLSFENALADLASFEHYAIDKRGLNGKWIAIGGSYPGVLAAYYRLKYSDLVVGALSSSAPVRAKYLVPQFDQFARDHLGTTCAAAFDQVAAKVKTLDAPTLQALEKTFGITKTLSTSDFNDYLSGFPEPIVQYGLNNIYCATLSAVDPFPGLAKMTQALVNSMGMTPDTIIDGPVATDVKLYEDGVGLRQWSYLQCTEFGFFDSDSDGASCTDLFGSVAFDKLWRVNRDYYQPLLNPKTTNILFTNGSNDPWSTLTISHENGNDTNPNTSAYTIAGASHCAELNAQPDPKNSDALNGAVDLVSKSFAAWLK